MVDGEAGDRGSFAAAGQRAEVHQCPGVAAGDGISSDSVDVAAVVGMTPSSGPVREITRETTGAAVQAAVVSHGIGFGRAGRVEHHQHHIARRVHRESRAKVETLARCE